MSTTQQPEHHTEHHKHVELGRAIAASIEAADATFKENGMPVEFGSAVTAAVAAAAASLKENEHVELDRFRPHGELEIDKLFRALVKFEGSDLHLKVGTPPVVRVGGTLRPLNRG